jgi:LDH2 family malate/lactate/ureidoglycolate dehydrogenase
MAGIITTNASANLVGPGAVRAIVGNNPIAFVAPGGPQRPAICADIALSQVAFGRIRIAARLGQPIPLGWARGVDGQPTTDAADAVAAQLLEPMGGHKGFALATMIEILAGIMTGSPFGASSNAHAGRDGGVGHLAIVFDPAIFISRQAFEDSIDRLDDELRAAMTDSNAITLPGQREERARQQALECGLPIATSVWERLEKLEIPGLPRPQPISMVA